METSNPRTRSDLPPDLVKCIFNRVSFTDFHRARIVSTNWYWSLKLTVPRKITSPWLILFPEGENDEDGNRVKLFNHEEEDRIYKSKRDFRNSCSSYEKTKEFVVVWFVDPSVNCLCFCKKGDDRFAYILLLSRVSMYDQQIYDVVLRGHSLYILTNHDYIRFIDFSGPRGELLLVENILDQRRQRSFHVFKKDHDPEMNQRYIEVISLGEEALLLRMHTTVPGLEPNSIYFTSHDSACHRFRMKTLHIDICVFNLPTKTLKRCSTLSNMKLKDALWFLPRT
ncbi:PREDICTED: F-box protein At2g14290-like [Camelina sativa]|uniref:F-box protein At2g14290-like n=1 Tax=Camelina sativa TaxID=90675 RepID=A0ABM0XS77_CAMSA|nr:PREDICTED: F-box protein At2g14290-like [Camelina sativa]